MENDQGSDTIAPFFVAFLENFYLFLNFFTLYFRGREKDYYQLELILPFNFFSL